MAEELEALDQVPDRAAEAVEDGHYDEVHLPGVRNKLFAREAARTLKISRSACQRLPRARHGVISAGPSTVAEEAVALG